MGVALEKQVLGLIGELLGLLELDELCSAMLRALRELVPSEWCALNEVPVDSPQSVSLTDPPVPDAIHEAFARHGAENPIAAHFLATGVGRATRFSDLVTQEELHGLELYRQVYVALGVEYQIAFTLPSSFERVLGVALSRGSRDFSDQERDLLNLARPYLIQIYRNALAYTYGRPGRIPLERLRALGLTRRQAQVLRLVATGQTTSEAAVALGIAPRTAQKHLERCYRVLGVSNRSKASQLAWSTVVSSGGAQAGDTQKWRSSAWSRSYRGNSGV